MSVVGGAEPPCSAAPTAAELPRVEIGPDAAFTFKPGGTHLMMVGMVGLKQQLKEGQPFPLTLEGHVLASMNGYRRAVIGRLGATELSLMRTVAWTQNCRARLKETT